MDQRDSSIKSELEASKSIGLDSDDLKAKAEQIIEDAKHEAQSIRQKAIEETKTLAMSKIVDKQKKLDKDYKAFITKLAKENESLKSSLLEQIPLFKETIKTKLAKL
jgi:F-type H+-transporting ATPase subunit b